MIVDRHSTGLSVGKVEKKLGIKGSGTSQLVFENVKVPKDQLLGKEGEGFKVAMTTLDGGRIGIASQALGISVAALQAAKAFTRERETFGKSTMKHQAVQFMIADMATRLEAARLLTWKAAALQSQGQPFWKGSCYGKALCF